MNPSASRLYDYLKGFYAPRDFSALGVQIARWEAEKDNPLRGKRILDGTPIFRNTMLKYCALLAAGADLTVSAGEGVPCDPAIPPLLPRFGIRFADASALTETYDAVSDCGGRHRQVRSQNGFVELTRSGVSLYRRCPQPVINADASVFKDFETAYGTGDGFVRAMKALGHEDLAGRRILVFGGGKVGLGIAVRCRRAGACPAVVDLKRPDVMDEKIDFIAAEDAAAVRRAIAEAWCVVSATSVAGALAPHAEALATSPALIANMGLDDEFSARLPADRVLNRKTPLNFILPEPTRLMFIAPVMALTNASLRLLLTEVLPPGLQDPPPRVSMDTLLDLAAAGINWNRELQGDAS
ncbi:MAG: hypothetical protein MR051_09390 [Lentisphaeria bacterium]|nr:hypothetical protein [Lentisphaeria bacterium]